MIDHIETNLIPFPQPEETKLLTHFDRAKKELELASSIDEVKKIRDQAEAFRQYARQQGHLFGMEKHPVAQVEHKSYPSFEVTLRIP